MSLVAPQPNMDHKFAKLLQSDQDSTLTFAILSRIFVCAQHAKMSPIYFKQSLDMKLLENCRSFIYECDHLGQLRQYAVCDRETL